MSMYFILDMNICCFEQLIIIVKFLMLRFMFQVLTNSKLTQIYHTIEINALYKYPGNKHAQFRLFNSTVQVFQGERLIARAMHRLLININIILLLIVSTCRSGIRTTDPRLRGKCSTHDRFFYLVPVTLNLGPLFLCQISLSKIHYIHVIQCY